MTYEMSIHVYSMFMCLAMIKQSQGQQTPNYVYDV